MSERAVSTRERYLNILMALLNYARGNGWLRGLPEFTRISAARKPKSRMRRRVRELTHELVAMMIEASPPHLKALLAFMWSTGARVSSILYGCRFCDIDLREAEEQAVLHKTKTGEDVGPALHPWAAKILREYVAYRGIPEDPESPFFLTHRGIPYRDNGRAWGGQTKTAFNTMKRRVAARLRAAGRNGEADLILKVTPHWFRHYLATHLLAKGFDLVTVMRQGGWLTMESVQTYAHGVTERQRQAAAALDTVDTPSTRDPIKKEKKPGNSSD